MTTYKSTAGDEGTGSYVFNGKGRENTGSLDVTKAAIKQAAPKSGPATFTATITGRLVKPGGMDDDGFPFGLPASGTWRIHLGGFTSAVIDVGNPVTAAQLKQTATAITFKAAKGSDGYIKQFNIQRKTGVFNLKLNKVPEDGNGVGLPLKDGGDNDLGINVDLFIGFEMDLGARTVVSLRRCWVSSRESLSVSTWAAAMAMSCWRDFKASRWVSSSSRRTRAVARFAVAFVKAARMAS